jgi:hypothetical protein
MPRAVRGEHHKLIGFFVPQWTTYFYLFTRGDPRYILRRMPVNFEARRPYVTFFLLAGPCSSWNMIFHGGDTILQTIPGEKT